MLPPCRLLHDLTALPLIAVAAECNSHRESARGKLASGNHARGFPCRR